MSDKTLKVNGQTVEEGKPTTLEFMANFVEAKGKAGADQREPDRTMVTLHVPRNLMLEALLAQARGPARVTVELY